MASTFPGDSSNWNRNLVKPSQGIADHPECHLWIWIQWLALLLEWNLFSLRIGNPCVWQRQMPPPAIQTCVMWPAWKGKTSRNQRKECKGIGYGSWGNHRDWCGCWQRGREQPSSQLQSMCPQAERFCSKLILSFCKVFRRLLNYKQTNTQK